MATPAPLPQRETRRSRRLRGQEPLSPRSPPAEVVGSAATPPFGGSPHSGGSSPIPTSLLLSSPQCISCSQFDVKMFFHSQQTKQNFKAEQRCRDGVMNEFVRHLLVSFLFHALTSLHPPSFHRNDFSTCCHLY